MDPLVPFVQTTLTIPASRLAEVTAGLASGVYERIGGVIRESGSHKVVLWLRPGAAVDHAFRLAPVTNLLSLTFSAMSMEYVRQRLNQIEADLRKVSAQLSRIEDKIDSAHIAQVQSALSHAQVAFSMKDPQNRLDACNLTIKGLINAESLLGELFESSLRSRPETAPRLLRTSAIIYSATAACMNAIGEDDLATIHLKEGAETVSKAARSLYEKELLPKRTFLMRPELADTVSLTRLADLTNQVDRPITESELFEDLRKDIWADSNESFEEQFRERFYASEQVIPSLNPIAGFRQTPKERDQRREKIVAHVSSVVEDLESALETASRLRGFAIEMEFISENNIGLEEWAKLTNNNESAATQGEAPTMVGDSTDEMSG